MSVHEEVEEHVHHAHQTFDKVVAASMAFIAALLAIVSVLGQHFNTEKLLNQQQASDMWAFYQAKDIRRYSALLAQDVLGQLKAGDNVTSRYTKDASRYRKETQEIQEKAREFEKERDKSGRQADFFHFGEVFLELAIVLSSLSILTKRRALYYGALGCTVTGIIIGAYGWTVFGLIAKS
jgi:Domain of unknown function (DUF4337)